jgi:hypothetical protein
MPHRPVFSTSHLNRRAALGSVGAIAAVLGLGSSFSRATAQDATPTTLATHPLAGTWLVWSPPPPSMNLAGLSPSIFAPDGSVVLEWAVSYVDPALPDVEVVFNTPGIGTWEFIDEHKAHFMVVTVISDAKGTLLGSATIEGHPMVSADGQTFSDLEPETRITVRDATNQVVSEQADVVAGVTATRMSPSAVVFPEGTSMAGTPTG